MVTKRNLALSTFSACLVISTINILQSINLAQPYPMKEQSVITLTTTVDQASSVGADETGVHTAATTSAAVLTTPQDEQEEDPKMHLPEQNIMDLLNTNGSQYFQVPGWLHSPSNVTIILDHARRDRLGGQMARVIKLSAYAHCKKYNFCVRSTSHQSNTQELGIPVCPEDQSRDWHEHKDFDKSNHSQSLAPGFYHYRQRVNADTTLDIILRGQDKFAKCKNDNEFRDYWRNNILSAPSRGAFQSSDTVKENLFKSENVTTIAVHVRRGDYTWELRRDVFTKDTVYIQAISQIRDMVQARASEGLDRPEVHLFSEDYGTVNWTSYEGLVDEWHLAPFMGGNQQMDWDLNIRDWIHFIKADITISSGAFSTLPSEFKTDPDPKTGLPLLLGVCSYNHNYRSCQKIKGAKTTYTKYSDFHDPNANDTQVALENLPDAWNLPVGIKPGVNTSSSKIETKETKHSPANFDFKVLPYMVSEKERTYIHQIQSLPPVPSGKKFVISYGLYGKNPKYIIGAIRNAELAPTYFPGWEMRFYVDDTVPSDAIKRLKDLGGNIIIRPDKMKDGASIGMFWRFLVSDDESVDRFIVRDSDSRLNARDRFAIEEWIQSNKSTHMARDHVNHPYAMNGGSWGGTKGFLKGKKITSLVEEFMDEPDKIGYGADIGFLMNKIWPIVSNDIMSHDAFHCVKYKGKPFPTKRDDNWQHVGQVFDANDKPVQRHMRKLKFGNPTECRPADHQDWIYG